MLLCLSSVDFGVLEEAVDLAGDVAFEAALGFSGGFAFGGSFGDVGLGVGAVAAAGDGDGVQRSVEAVAGVLPGGRFERGDAGEAGSRVAGAGWGHYVARMPRASKLAGLVRTGVCGTNQGISLRLFRQKMALTWVFEILVRRRD